MHKIYLYLPEFDGENGETSKMRASVLSVEVRLPTPMIYEVNDSLLVSPVTDVGFS